MTTTRSVAVLLSNQASHAIRSDNLITGQQQRSSGAAAKLVIEALA